MDYEQKLEHYARMTEKALEEYLSGECGKGYDLIFQACKYSVLAGGKRLRPALTMEFCHLCGGTPEMALPFACALEMIHTYSLIHDDLPCMDNDDLRRGKPTSHKIFGEATAVLAGDALLTKAFQIASDRRNLEGMDAEHMLYAVQILASAAGMDGGMIGGQILDMQSEHQTLETTQLIALQEMKTGALIRAACVLGCVAAEKTDEDTLHAAREYGSKLGLAFQIVDDMLDVEGDPSELGKSIGKDANSEKSTFPSQIGLAECRKMVDQLSDEANALLHIFPNPEFLIALTNEMRFRRN